ncbi:MAG: protein kinase domain-containing protein, partial [Cellulomonas sp.]
MPHETVSPDSMPAALAARLAAAGWVPAGRLGAGAHGPAWAVQRSDGLGTRAVVRDVRVDTGRVETCAAGLEALRRLDNPHVARVLDVLDDGPGGPLVLVDEVAGPTLAALVNARGTVQPGEVVTVVVAMARALAALHRAGLVHGDVAPSNVVIDPAGKPVLIDLWGTIGADGDLGTPGFASAAVLAGRPPCPADDVHALGRLGLWALGDEASGAGRAVAALLRDACDSAVPSRPTPAELEERCHAASPPEPLRMPDAAALARAEIVGGARTSRALLPTRRRPAPPGVAAGIVQALGLVSRGASASRRAPRRTVPAAGAARGARAAHRARGTRTMVSSRVVLAGVLGVCAVALGNLALGNLALGSLALGNLGLGNLANGADARVVDSRQGQVGGELSPSPS